MCICLASDSPEVALNTYERLLAQNDVDGAAGVIQTLAVTCRDSEQFITLLNTAQSLTASSRVNQLDYRRLLHCLHGLEFVGELTPSVIQRLALERGEGELRAAAAL